MSTQPCEEREQSPTPQPRDSPSKQTDNSQLVAQQKRQLTQEQRAKLLARIIEVILADPGVPVIENDCEQEAD